MFGEIFDRIRASSERRRLLKQPACSSAIAVVDAVLSDPKEPLFEMRDETKVRIREGMLSEFDEILRGSTNQVQQVRGKLANSIGEATRVGVLLTTPELSPHPWITGGLRDWVGVLAEKSSEVKEILYGLKESPTTQAEVIDCLYAEFHLKNLRLMAYQAARFALNDYHEDKKRQPVHDRPDHILGVLVSRRTRVAVKHQY